MERQQQQIESFLKSLQVETLNEEEQVMVLGGHSQPSHSENSGDCQKTTNYDCNNSGDCRNSSNTECMNSQKCSGSGVPSGSSSGDGNGGCN